MIGLLILALIAVPAADTLSLADCYAAAEDNHPLASATDLYDEIEALRIANINAALYPKLVAGAQAAYQSAVPELPFDGSVSVSRDQYKFSLGFEHLLYNGGTSGVQREMERLQGELGRDNAAVEVYNIRDRVEVAYFGVLFQQASAATLRASEETLEAELAQLRARIAEGVATEADADVLEVELLGIRRRIDDAEAGRAAAMSVLAILTGLDLGASTTLALPEPQAVDPSTGARLRPEYRAMEVSRRLLSARQELVARRRRPQVGAMVEAAYGRPPGQNIFEDTFQPFITAGVRLQWAVWNWGIGAREREALDVEADMVTAREEAFTQQLRASIEQQTRDVERIATLLATDEEIIARRQRITEQAASRLANGVITATEYIAVRNAEHQSRLALEMHRIQLAQARAKLVTTLGVETR